MSGFTRFATGASINPYPLDADLLLGRTWSNPLPIGSVTPSTGDFTFLTSNDFHSTIVSASNLISTNSTSTNVVTTNLLATNVTIPNLIVTNLDTINLTAGNIILPNLTADKLMFLDSNKIVGTSTSLLSGEPATISAHLSADFNVLQDTDTQIITANVGIDASGTSAYSASIFNVLGQNISGAKIFVNVSFSIVYEANSTGIRQFWLQTSASTVRYGLIQQEGNALLNALTGSCMIGLEIGESAAFFTYQNANPASLNLLGGVVTTEAISKWQTHLVN